MVRVSLEGSWKTFEKTDNNYWLCKQQIAECFNCNIDSLALFDDFGNCLSIDMECADEGCTQRAWMISSEGNYNVVGNENPSCDTPTGATTRGCNSPVASSSGGIPLLFRMNKSIVLFVCSQDCQASRHLQSRTHIIRYLLQIH